MSKKSRAQLVAKYRKLEKNKFEILAMLKNQTYEKLNHSDGDNWSVNQILYHHYQAEKLSLEYIKKKIDENDTLEKAGFVESIKSKLLNFLLWLPVKYKSPKRIADVPETVELDELSTKWSDLRFEMKTLIDKIPEKTINSKIFNHPRIGMITIGQALEFIDWHLKHHLPQIKNQL